jgi:hypothetical protein
MNLLRVGAREVHAEQTGWKAARSWHLRFQVCMRSACLSVLLSAREWLSKIIVPIFMTFVTGGFDQKYQHVIIAVAV